MISQVVCSALYVPIGLSSSFISHINDLNRWTFGMSMTALYLHARFTFSVFSCYVNKTLLLQIQIVILIIFIHNLEVAYFFVDVLYTALSIRIWYRFYNYFSMVEFFFGVSWFSIIIQHFSVSCFVTPPTIKLTICKQTMQVIEL